VSIVLMFAGLAVPGAATLRAGRQLNRRAAAEPAAPLASMTP
jgi:hypothetical protein